MSEAVETGNGEPTVYRWPAREHVRSPADFTRRLPEGVHFVCLWKQHEALVAHLREQLAQARREVEGLREALGAVWQWRMKGTRGDAMPEPIADIVRAALAQSGDKPSKEG